MLESQLQQPISLVQNQDLQIFKIETLCVHKVVDQTAWRGYDEIWAFPELVLLFFDIGLTDDQGWGQLSVLVEIIEHEESLNG